MNEPAQLDPCGLCNRSGRDLEVGLSLVNLHIEARRAGLPIPETEYGHVFRCRPCRDAVRNRTPLPPKEETPQ